MASADLEHALPGFVLEPLDKQSRSVRELSKKYFTAAQERHPEFYLISSGRLLPGERDFVLVGFEAGAGGLDPLLIPPYLPRGRGGP